MLAVRGKCAFGVRFSLLFAGLLALSGFTQQAAANVIGTGGGPVNNPVPLHIFGPGIPYISGRLGPVRAPVEAPVGSVFPDEFCLSGKGEECGDSLRNAPDLFPAAPDGPDGPVFVGAGDLSFGQIRQSVWAEGQYRQTELSALSEERRTRSFAIGGDRLFGTRFILGAMVVGNNTTTSFLLTGIDDRESGIQVGPYFAYQLSDNLILDGRFVAGNAEHTVTTGGVQTGQYQSLDGFGALRVSGTFIRDQWRLHPSLEVATQFQDSDAYVDGLRGPIAASRTSDTFVTAALLAYYNGLSVGNGRIDPYIGLEAIRGVNGTGDLFGAVRAGMATTLGAGSILNIDFAYGAIGLDNTNDQQISIRLEIPF